MNVYKIGGIDQATFESIWIYAISKGVVLSIEESLWQTWHFETLGM